MTVISRDNGNYSQEVVKQCLDEILQDLWSYGFDGHVTALVVSPEFLRVLDADTFETDVGKVQLIEEQQ